jgi:hypothetical protein
VYTRSLGYQLGLNVPAKEIKINVFDSPTITELRQMVIEHRKHCAWCGKEKLDRHMFSRLVYPGPWATDPEWRYCCSEKCEEIDSEEEFYCDECSHTIPEHNGHHNNYRFINDSMICLKCYEAEIIENGVSKGSLIKGHLPGMFFNYGNKELLDVGYECKEDNIFVDHETSKDLCACALNWIKQGYKVIIAYENLSITSDEGWVSLFVKKGEEDNASL